ncbi:MAG: hypothetical protein ACREU7_11805, partial [Burkholderiales bacterium]
MDEARQSDVRNSRWIAGLLVTVCILALFWPLLADRSLAMRDAGHFYHPLLKWTSEQWLRGSPPLWNPYENAGMPLLADGSSALFYPGRLVLLLPLDFAWRFNLYVVGHVVLAAVGAYLLARHFQASVLAAGVAAMSYACGGSVVFQHSNIAFLISAAWLPFAAWAIDAMLVSRSWRTAVALGVVLALMILGGDPQMAYHVLLMAALYALLLLRHKPEAQAREKSNTRMEANPSLALRACHSIALIGLAAICGFALAAVQILPLAEAARTSDRAYYKHPRSIYEAAAYVARGEGDDHRWAGVARGLFGQPEPTTHHDRLYDFSIA